MVAPSGGSAQTRQPGRSGSRKRQASINLGRFQPTWMAVEMASGRRFLGRLGPPFSHWANFLIGWADWGTS